MSQGTVALILIFLEEARGAWVNVADMAHRLALSEPRVTEALGLVTTYAPGVDLELQIDAQQQVTAARMPNGALEVL